uniref:Uncharacterized protein n=1 Tax=Ditylenchus dipsaci TaxID=166011 RepID=A0A915CWC3_9BILA
MLQAMRVASQFPEHGRLQNFHWRHCACRTRSAATVQYFQAKVRALQPGCCLILFSVKEIKTPVFCKVVEWCRNHVGVPEPVVRVDPNTGERIWFDLTDYERNFFEVPVDELAELLSAGNYLDLKSLYLFGCQSMAA